MPNYDYRCPKCGTFEQWQSIKDDPLKKCPTCKRKALSKSVGKNGLAILPLAAANRFPFLEHHERGAVRNIVKQK